MAYFFEPYLKKWKFYETLAETTLVTSNNKSESYRKEAINIINAIQIAKTSLSEEEFNILYDFYYKKKKIDQICIDHGFSRSQYYRIRKKALNKMDYFRNLIE